MKRMQHEKRYNMKRVQHEKKFNMEFVQQERTVTRKQCHMK